MTCGKMGFALVLPFRGVRGVKAKPILLLYLNYSGVCLQIKIEYT